MFPITPQSLFGTYGVGLPAASTNGTPSPTADRLLNREVGPGGGPFHTKSGATATAGTVSTGGDSKDQTPALNGNGQTNITIRSVSGSGSTIDVPIGIGSIASPTVALAAVAAATTDYDADGKLKYGGAATAAALTSGNHLWKYFIAILPLALATFVAISRTVNYFHHFVDICAGK
jgi:hypothetical protein